MCRLRALPPGLLYFPILFLVLTGCSTSPSPADANEEVQIKSVRPDEAQDPGAVTRAQLQTEVMRFADHVVARLTQALQELEESDPATDVWRIVFEDSLFTAHAAYTIAADPNPSIGALDMIVLVSLGRIVYEEDRLPELGQSAEPTVRAFQSLESEVWSATGDVLSPDQQEDLRGMIRDWRVQNPGHRTFFYIRFGHFAGLQADSDLAKEAESGGLFDSVDRATRQIDEVRNLAERGMFLGTRMPLLTSAYVELLMVQMLRKPEIRKLLGDVNQLSGLAAQMPEYMTEERKATVSDVMKRVTVLREETVEDVMGRVKVERSEAIDQALEGLTQQRKGLIDQLVAEEERVRGVLGDLRQTVVAANELATSVNTLTARLIPERPEGAEPVESKPLDIKDIRGALVEVTQILHQSDGLVRTLDQLMGSPNWDARLPQLLETLDRVEAEGEEFLDHSFRQAAILILITLLGLLGVLITYQYVSKKLHESSRPPVR